MAKTILFQGDSITDCGRTNDPRFVLGCGYASRVSATLAVDYPNEYEFINRGVGGNRIVDMYARIKCDFINKKPDYASILIGVNDVWHEITENNGVDTPKFEKIYSLIIDEVYKALPDIKLMIIAPFVLEGSATQNTEEMPDRLERFKKGVAEKAEASKRIAEKYNLPFIELQSAFDEAVKKAPNTKWTCDGVHPNSWGHEIIKRLWLEAFEKIK